MLAATRASAASRDSAGAGPWEPVPHFGQAVGLVAPRGVPVGVALGSVTVGGVRRLCHEPVQHLFRVDVRACLGVSEEGKN